MWPGAQLVRCIGAYRVNALTKLTLTELYNVKQLFMNTQKISLNRFEHDTVLYCDRKNRSLTKLCINST